MDSIQTVPVAVPQQQGIRGFITRHRLTSFFILATALSWLAWIPYVLSENGLGVLHFSFPQVLGTSQLLGVLPGAYLGPIFSAYLVTRISEGKAGVRAWLRRFTKWRVNWFWYVSIIVAVPAALTIALIPFAGLDNVYLPPAEVLVAYLPALLLQVVTTGLAEEPGWRDFAIPHLQPRFGPVRGTLILGPVWGVWHLPLFFSEWGGWPDVNALIILEFIAGATTFSFVMTWVFNRTGESLPLAMLCHCGINNFMSTAAPFMFPTVNLMHANHLVLLIASGAVAVILLVATRGRLGYRPRRTNQLAPAA